MQAHVFSLEVYLSVQQKLFFYPKKIIYPLLLPSHNCIIIHNVQFSRCNLNFFKKLNEASLSRNFSQFLKKKWWARTRFSAEKPRRLQQSTGLLPSAAFRVHFGFSCLCVPDCRHPDSYSFVFFEWWAKMDSNHRPHDYQSCALAS